MMYCRDGQRLYLKAWEFNTCRVLGALAEIVEKNGGKVKPYRHILANNRTYEPDAEPVRIYGQEYIKFIVDGHLYDFSIDDNPFFPHYYSKVKIGPDGKVPCLHQVYVEELPRDKWIYDCLFRTATNEQVAAIAEKVFSLLVEAEPSQIERKTNLQYEEVKW